MKPKVYVETTIVSYLAARPSRDLVAATRQQLTEEWWRTCRDRFRLFISPAVVTEVSAGDQDAASRRLALCGDLELLPDAAEVDALASALLNEGVFPPKAAADSTHVAFAAVHEMKYLVTWNCTHIANAALRDRIQWVCQQNGCDMPIICTPEELMP